MTGFFLATLLFLGATAVEADDSETDKQVVGTLIQGAVNDLVSVLRRDDLLLAEKRDRVTAILDPLIDYALMAKLTLGRKQWQVLEQDQRKSFTDLFLRILRESYFEKLVLFTDEVIEIEEPVAHGTKFHVLSYIESKGERVQVVYKLFKKDKNWKIYDFEIEGVSIVKSYGAQYRDFLREASIEGLLEEMRAKVAAADKRIRKARSTRQESEAGSAPEKKR